MYKLIKIGMLLLQMRIILSMDQINNLMSIDFDNNLQLYDNIFTVLRISELKTLLPNQNLNKDIWSKKQITNTVSYFTKYMNANHKGYNTHTHILTINKEATNPGNISRDEETNLRKTFSDIFDGKDVLDPRHSFDADILIEYFRDEFEKMYHTKIFPTDLSANKRLRFAAERAKSALSTQTTTSIELDRLLGTLDFHIVLTREKFNDLYRTTSTV
jgi:hypothetical protein